MGGSRAPQNESRRRPCCAIVDAAMEATDPPRHEHAVWMKFIGVVLLAAVMLVLVVAHVWRVNGPWYWVWPWRHVPWARTACVALAASPVAAAVWVYSNPMRGDRRAGLDRRGVDGGAGGVGGGAVGAARPVRRFLPIGAPEHHELLQRRLGAQRVHRLARRLPAHHADAPFALAEQAAGTGGVLLRVYRRDGRHTANVRRRGRDAGARRRCRWRPVTRFCGC